TDSASGMRVFRREILERVYPLPDGLNLTPVMSTRAVHEGIGIEEVPIPYSERVGRSKLSVIRDGSIFMQSMLWTALSYNPVRILGLLGFAGLGIASIVFLWILYLRSQGILTLAPWGVAALFRALISTVTGVNLIALGIAFNYLVALFYKQPIRQGMFGKPIFKSPLDKHFGWMGVTATVAGPAIALVALLVGANSWAIDRLWFYMVCSALVFLVGVQLVVYWLLLRILEELSQREVLTKQDMG
ncbi:MAG: glycosyltransferase family 2 protein, partial [Chloroflexota bacterium]